MTAQRNVDALLDQYGDKTRELAHTAAEVACLTDLVHDLLAVATNQVRHLDGCINRDNHTHRAPQVCPACRLIVGSEGVLDVLGERR